MVDFYLCIIPSHLKNLKGTTKIITRSIHRATLLFIMRQALFKVTVLIHIKKSSLKVLRAKYGHA